MKNVEMRTVYGMSEMDRQFGDCFTKKKKKIEKNRTKSFLRTHSKRTMATFTLNKYVQNFV